MVFVSDYDCELCADTGILSDGESLCACPASACVYGPDDDFSPMLAEAEDRRATA